MPGIGDVQGGWVDGDPMEGDHPLQHNALAAVAQDHETRIDELENGGGGGGMLAALEWAPDPEETWDLTDPVGDPVATGAALDVDHAGWVRVDVSLMVRVDLDDPADDVFVLAGVGVQVDAGAVVPVTHQTIVKTAVSGIGNAFARLSGGVMVELPSGVSTVTVHGLAQLVQSSGSDPGVEVTVSDSAPARLVVWEGVAPDTVPAS